VSLGTPIMSEEWIFRCWDFRDDVAVSANDEHLVLICFVVSVVNITCSIPKFQVFKTVLTGGF